MIAICYILLVLFQPRKSVVTEIATNDIYLEIQIVRHEIIGQNKYLI